MKGDIRSINRVILLLPLIGVVILYIYVLVAILLLDTTLIYNNDPKLLVISCVYSLVRNLVLIGLLSILYGVLVLGYRIIKSGVSSVLDNSLVYFIIGTALNVILSCFDPMGYINWFFD